MRSANLAAIYQDDGMFDLSVREATLGVNEDYSNASSHLFLANSYNALRDPTRINLRYETPWFNELLLANLLAPVGGGPLSQFVSEQEVLETIRSQPLWDQFDDQLPKHRGRARDRFTVGNLWKCELLFRHRF